MGRSWEAVCALHEALAVGPQDPVATDLLGRALEENATMQGWGNGNGMDVEDEAENVLENFTGARSVAARRKAARMGKGKERSGSGGKGRVSELGVGEDSMMVMSDEE